MSYRFTHSRPRDAILARILGARILGAYILGAWAVGASTFSADALAAGETGRVDNRFEVPPAASGSPLIENIEVPIRPQTYPTLPKADPLQPDPEQIREDLRRAVEQAFAEEPELADAAILVHVTSLRRARLSGNVESESTRILAEILARGVNGISGVDNGLQIYPGSD